MTSKIFRSTILVAAVVLMCSLCVIMGVLYNHFTIVQVHQLRDELSLAVTATEQYGNAFLENVEGDRFRITWIGADGTVLYDTRVTLHDMENHADREEIQEALETGQGSSSRYSATLMEKTFYEARKLRDGSILRISNSQASASSLLIGLFYPMILIVIIAIALSAVLANRVAKKIVAPLNCLDLEHPLKQEVYTEIEPLMRRINRLHLQISAQMEKLRRKTTEFEQIIGNMKEGLVLLDSEGTILSINPTARTLFGTDADCVGRNFLLVERSSEMRQALNDALDLGRGTTRLCRNGRDYQFDLTWLESDGAVVGAVVLAYDITEGLNAERSRREFTANVSHELKTPLQSIIGSAELLESELVKPEDTARFVGYIHREAKRLISLVEDIIRLSQLEEGLTAPAEEVDLFAIAQEVALSLAPVADAKNVRLEVDGEPFLMEGVRRMLHDIVYNLADNAIKYNISGGDVKISVRGKYLTVTDTGIGIPVEHQNRIFERFYRVDKSHSRQSGGTGLGLSIVKHAVAHHHAALELQSVPGKGTTITVRF